MADTKHPAVAVVGAGVIGAGWAARFVNHGFDVSVFDPSPDASRVLLEVQRNADAAWEDLGLPAPRRGKLELCSSIDETIEGAEWIQESVPEVLALKCETLAQIADACLPHALIGSSTSGFKCSELAAHVRHPERVVVAHPFNPVYLVPLVEIVGGRATTQATIDTAMAKYQSIGMHPLHVRAEIDAHIADRLLEAVWREALWLINDGIATTEEIDDAIRYGFGLRWAQMGLFETYRIAGGEGGMAHFIRQFGPALSWPWSKLTDVPDLTDELVERIAAQSESQSGQYTIRELERLRDRNLASIMLALESQDWGAGQTLATMRERLGARLSV